MNRSIPTYDVAIVGAGVGGTSAAEAVLDQDDGRRVLLLNEEEWAPYDRPPLSKDVLLGQAQTTDFALLNDALCANPNLTIRTGVGALRIDRQDKQLTLTDGSVAGYGSLILATGSKTRRLDPSIVDAAATGSIFYLKTLGDAQALRTLLAAGDRRNVVVVGAGFIGLEVAAAATLLGCDVTVLEAGPRIVGRGAPRPVSEFLKARHEQAGVRFMLNTQATRLAAAGEKVRITLSSGETLTADTVVVGIGTTANDALASSAGILCDNGIVVDECCRTSDPSIYAIGDVARVSAAGAVRMEHWQAARSMGAVAARNACGGDEIHREVPWIWTDQYDENIQFLGHSSEQNHQVRRAGASDRKWIVFEKKDDIVVGASLVNSGRERRTVERLIARRSPIPDDRLMDPQFDLKSILG